jgi:sodium transport system permease protein
VYARSSKEGQYYLMPLFLVTLPLVLLTLAPGVELNAFYALVPVTGVALLIQKLMLASSFDKVPWLYFGPVLATVALYSLLALRWAVEQFQREEVLFREAERLDLGLLFKRLFRRKESLPSVGQAVFCFALAVGLRWLFLGTGGAALYPGNTAVAYLTLLAPTLFMAVLLTRRPDLTLGLRPPAYWTLMLTGVLSCLALPAGLWLWGQARALVPALDEYAANGGPTGTLLAGPDDRPNPFVWLPYFLLLALLPAVAEELTFRGFVLAGMRRRFSPRVAVVVSAFFFGLYQIDLAAFLPAFLAGVGLGLLATRARSVLPGVMAHLAYSGTAATATLLRGLGRDPADVPWELLLGPTVLLVCGLLGLTTLLGLTVRLVRPPRAESPPVPLPLPLAELPHGTPQAPHDP